MALLQLFLSRQQYVFSLVLHLCRLGMLHLHFALHIMSDFRVVLKTSSILPNDVQSQRLKRLNAERHAKSATAKQNNLNAHNGEAEDDNTQTVASVNPAAFQGFALFCLV